MTVNVTTTRMPPYAGNGVAQDFPFAFRILDATHVQVTLTAGGVDTLQMLNTQYTVSGVRAPAGNVHMLVAPAVGETLTIRRMPPYLQLVDLSDNDNYLGQTHEDIADRIYMALLDLADGLGTDAGSSRVLRLGDTDVDGAGSYRAKNNRIQDLRDAVNAQDAVNRRTMEALLQGASLGVPTVVPPFWEIVSTGGNLYDIPGATLSPPGTYIVSLDGVMQPPSSYQVSVDFEQIQFDTDTFPGVNIVVRCVGYAAPMDPAPVVDESTRPTEDLSILGMRVRFRSLLGGPTLLQQCELNSADLPEWVTYGVTS